MATEDRPHLPTCMYRKEGGQIVSHVFDHPDDIPKGKDWVDTPAKLQDKPKSKAKK